MKPYALTEEQLKGILYDGHILPEQAGYAKTILNNLQPYLQVPSPNRRKNSGRRKYEKHGQVLPAIKKRRKLIPIFSGYPLFDRRDKQ